MSILATRLPRRALVALVAVAAAAALLATLAAPASAGYWDCATTPSGKKVDCIWVPDDLLSPSRDLDIG